MEIDTTPWRPDDKAWIAERKKEWAFVQYNLKVLGGSFIDERNIVSTHKNLFFKGFYEPGQYDQGSGGSVFGNKLPLFVMWYHPALTPDVCLDVIAQCDKRKQAAQSLSLSLHALHKFSYHKKFRKEYGFMGGKEAVITPVMMSEKSRIVITKHGYNFISINSVASNVFSSINGTLRSLNCPWHTGLYMWSYFLEMVDTLNDEYYIGFQRTAAQMVIYFDQDPNTCKDDPKAIELKNKLLEQYESGEFPNSLQRVWDEGKALGPRTA